MSDLYGLPEEKMFDGKTFRRVGVYTSIATAEKDARRYRKQGRYARIVKVPNPGKMPWKYGCYVRWR